MRVIYKNILEIDSDAYSITTNGIVKSNNRVVMGADNAKEFKNKFKDIDLKLDTLVNKFGNRVFKIDDYKDITIFSFPTKHHYKDSSDINLIVKSTNELVELTNEFKNVYIPFPGISNGNLDIEIVYDKLKDILVDDKFKLVILTYKFDYLYSRGVLGKLPKYEVSSIGDKCYSALYVKLDDRTIKEIYQLDIKGYRKYSNDWRYGKDKPPIKNYDGIYSEYGKL